jgi:uncharacterized protein YndB with AHSA1/START domain
VPIAVPGDGATERAIGTKLIAAGEARTALLRRRYPHVTEDAWRAITDPVALRRWFIEPRGNLRLGGTFSLEGSAHGRILLCDRPRLLRVSWLYGPGHGDELEVRLSKVDDGRTLLELEHASIAAGAADGATDALVTVGVGWELAMAYLDLFLRDELPAGSTGAGHAAAEPSASDRALVAESAQAWNELLESAD